MPRIATARFVAEIVRLDSGLRHHILPVPEAVAARFKAARVTRLVGTVNGQPIRRALQSDGDGGHFLLFGQDALAELGLRRGSRVAVELKPDPKPATIELPEEFAAALATDDAARTRWATFTPGLQRSLMHWVTSAKQEPTRIRRALELARKIRTRTLHSDRR